MAAFWARLFSGERRLERYKRRIDDLTRQVRALQQQLLDQRGT
jgi:hypothetical protein